MEVMEDFVSHDFHRNSSFAPVLQDPMFGIYVPTSEVDRLKGPVTLLTSRVTAPEKEIKTLVL